MAVGPNVVSAAGARKTLTRSLAQSADWLVSVTANSAEERNMRLMGLVWSKAPRQSIRLAMKDCDGATEVGRGMVSVT